MPVHALAHWLAQSITEIALPAPRYVAAVSALLALRVVTSHRAVRPVPAEHARDLHGKLILMVGAFTPSGYTLFTRLAARGARLVALSSPPITSREHQLLHLATQNLSPNEELYIETCDLSSVDDIKRFAEEYERKAAVRRGALGEEIGRQHLDTLLLLPTERGHPAESLELLKALTPSLLKPTAIPGAPSQPLPTRVICVLRSPFYAAADLPSFPLTSMWRRDAADSLRTAALLIEEHRRIAARSTATSGKVACMAVSPGLTRSAIFDTILSAAQDRSTPIWAFIWLLAMVLSPLIWAIGKSGSEAARAVERLVLAPLEGHFVQPKEGEKVSTVRAGTLYRGEADAGRFLRSVSHEARAKKLYEEDEARQRA